MQNREIIDLQLSLVLFGVSINVGVGVNVRYYNIFDDIKYDYFSERFERFLGVKITEEQYRGLLCELPSELYYNISDIIGFENLKPQALSMLNTEELDALLKNFPKRLDGMLSETNEESRLEKYSKSFGLDKYRFRFIIFNKMLYNKDLNRLINLHFILNT